jgi:hypothetical protein
MRHLLGRFRLLVPPATYLVIYVLAYLACNLPLLFLGVNVGAGGLPGVVRGRQCMLIFGLLAYGAYRALAFHPYYRSGYRKWLESTPWTWRKPLPVGPVRPVIEDVIIVSAMSAPAWFFGDFEYLATFCLPLGSYLMVISASFPATGAWGFHVPVVLAVGLALRICDGPALGYSAAILFALAFGLAGLRRSLRRWPWDLKVPDFDPNKVENWGHGAVQIQTLKDELGWPYDRLGPRRDGPPTWRGSLDVFFSCIAIAWWFYAILGLAPENGRGPIAFMVLMYAMLFTLIHRITRYLMGYASPLGLGGRIARFSPIIPSYDQVFVAPIAAVFAITVGPWMLNRLGLAWDASASIALAAALIALFLGGPDRRRWQLTAKHRVVPAITGSARTKGGFIQVG